jgi:hypothetical protein
MASALGLSLASSFRTTSRVAVGRRAAWPILSARLERAGCLPRRFAHRLAGHSVARIARALNEVIAAGQRHVFDSFECAIQAMSPVCEHCGCRVIGHGTEVDGQFFCCAHCARAETSTDRVSDRAVTV